jgi:hypothetical protein
MVVNNMNKEETIQELKKNKEILLYIKQFIEKECVYDNHLQGYVFDLPRGKVKTLMYTIKQMEKGDKYDKRNY